jgi:hypothetical protein
MNHEHSTDLHLVEILYHKFQVSGGMLMDRHYIPWPSRTFHTNRNLLRLPRFIILTDLKQINHIYQSRRDWLYVDATFSISMDRALVLNEAIGPNQSHFCHPSLENSP